MPKKKVIEIGNRHWDFQKDALEFYKNILNSYETGEFVIDDDFNDIFSLLKNHPSSIEKIGVGIDRFKIGSDAYGTKCFHIIRNDGSLENFSYKKAIVGDCSSFTKFSKACRKTVEKDIIKVKDDYFTKTGVLIAKAKCQETGELITREDSHVDHRQPNTFSVIVDRFIESRKINIDSVEYDSKQQYGIVFKDPQLSSDFREYHKLKATLRVVTADLNQRRSYQARIQRQKKDLVIK
jgi:hypothetical protein